ncbi:MAG: serine hydrolase domain-containing protein [Mesorhizobium sp.]|nr:serine hydrolase domain-containing protein [Mesorhizobium sp.]
MTRGFSDTGLVQLRQAMHAHVDSGNVPGLVALVARGDEVHEITAGRMALGGPPMRRDAIFRLASMTKPITATAAMILVDEGILGLDDPVDRHLPELANREVLKSVDAPLTETAPATRPITLRDLLTMRFGLGAIMIWPPRYPIQHAQAAAGIAPGWTMFDGPQDELIRAVASLPLAHQPGEGWLYHTGMDVAGVLVARAAGTSFGAFCKERIFDPLGMQDTGFYVPPSKTERLPRIYRGDGKGGLTIAGDLGGGDGSRPPGAELGGGNIVSTADDYLAFCRMLLGSGTYRGIRILSPESVAEMTRDQLTPAQRDSAPLFFGGHSSWGLGMAVSIRRDNVWNVPGRFGWDGGYGTSAYSDPEHGLIGILLTQRLMESPEPPGHFTDFWTGAYAALA